MAAWQHEWLILVRVVDSKTDWTLEIFHSEIQVIIGFSMYAKKSFT